MPKTVPLFRMSIEDVDQAVNDWFDKTVDARVPTPRADLEKVRVVFSQGERWAAGRTKGLLRDPNGVLILPVISVRRIAIDPDPSRTALGAHTPSIQIARRVDLKTSDVRNLGWLGSVYDVYSIPMPNGMIATYQLAIQAQFISQMNLILEKIWRSLDIGRQFVAPVQNDGRQQTPRLRQELPDGPLLNRPYVVGFLEGSYGDAGNLEEFTDQERIIKYQTDITVPFALQVQSEGQEPAVKVERTAYKVAIVAEAVHWDETGEEIERIFGPPEVIRVPGR